MTFSIESQNAVDSYLAALRKQLHQLTGDDADDIVEEIRAHILEKAADGSPAALSTTLEALGTPAELASRYRADELLKRARLTASPFVSLRSLFRWASLSLVGLVIFLISVAGYFLGGALLLFTMLKLTWPRGTGLWKSSNPDGTWGLNMSSTSGTPPPGQELLGWWVVPICLFLGAGLLLLTLRFGTWSSRKFWRVGPWQSIER